MEQLKFIETECIPIVANVNVLALQIYWPDSHTFSDQIVNFIRFSVKMYRFERNKDVLSKFISKEISKLFIFFLLKTNLACKIFGLQNLKRLHNQLKMHWNVFHLSRSCFLQNFSLLLVIIFSWTPFLRDFTLFWFGL